MKLELPAVNPFHRGSWSGKIWSLEKKISLKLPEKDDLEEILFEYDSGDHYNGVYVGVVRLKDKRYISWETTSGSTGDGFSEDAYGGDANIYVSKTLKKVAMFGLTAESRELCGFTNFMNFCATNELTDFEQALVLYNLSKE